MELQPFVGMRMVVPVVKVGYNHVAEWEANLTRTLNNTPFQYFFEDEVLEGVIVADLTDLLDSCRHRAQQKMADIKAKTGKNPPFAPIYRKILAQELRIPIQYNGRSYFLTFGWGSGAKDKKVWAMTRDFMKAMKCPQIAEDGVRCTRFLLPNNLYGAGICKGLRVKFVKKGTNWNGYVLHDGISAVRRSLIEAMHSGQPKIQMGEGRQSYQVWQVFPWEEIQPEAQPLLETFLDAVAADENNKWEVSVQKELHYDEFVAADPALARHPHFVQGLSRQTARRVAEWATTIPLNAIMRVAVPSRTNYIVTDPGWRIGVRFPVDSPTNVRSFEVPDTDEARAEKAWLDEQEVVQWGWCSKLLHVKGDAWSVPDELMVDEKGKQWDVILCVEDIKMYRPQPGWEPQQNIYMARRQSSIIINEDVFIGIQQWWAPGSLVAIPYDYRIETHDTDHSAHEEGSPVYGQSKEIVWEWNKERKAWDQLVQVWVAFGGDYDGDMMLIIIVDGFPLIWNAPKKFRYVASIKIGKSTNPLEERVQLLINSLMSAVGMASTVMSTSFGVGATDAARAEMAEVMHLGNVPTLDQWNNSKVKEQTDQLKTMKVDAIKSFEDIVIKMGHQNSRYHGGVPWARWQNSKVAFVNELPFFRKDMPQEYKDKAADKKTGPDFRKSDKYRIQIPNDYQTGTIGTIYNIALPHIAKWFLDPETGNYLLAQISTADLSSFLDRVPEVPAYALEKAAELLKRYKQLRTATFAKVDMIAQAEDLTDTSTFEAKAPIEADLLATMRETWQNDLAKAEARGDFTNHMELVYALFTVSHATEADKDTAGAAFEGFPREMLWIFKNKPGWTAERRSKVIQTIVTGLGWNFINGDVPLRIEHIAVEIKEDVVAHQIRKAIISHDDEISSRLQDNREQGYPLHTIGVVIPITYGHMKTYNVVNPKAGMYWATFVRMSGRASWMVTLEPREVTPTSES